MSRDILPIVLDAETNIRNIGPNAVGNFAASPFHPDNHIVAFQYQVPGTTQCRVCYDAKNEYDIVGQFTRMMKHYEASYIPLLIGHNIKFDLLYLLKHEEFTKWFFSWVKCGGRIYDTMLAEYLLSGQEVLYPSLNYCSERYGGTQKEDRIKKYWADKIDTAEIPKTLLLNYLKEDVENTELTYHRQREQLIENPDLHRLVDSQMDALLMTTIMEKNGMWFDVRAASVEANDVAATAASVETNIRDEFKQVVAGRFDQLTEIKYKWATDPNIMKIEKKHSLLSYVDLYKAVNIDSPMVLGALLFGGLFRVPYTECVREEDGKIRHYKSGAKKGEPVLKHALALIEMDGMFTPPEKYTSKCSTGWRVDDSVLKRLSNSHPSALVNQLREYRRLEKELKSSYMSLIEVTWPTDNCLHGTLNHVGTGTGRLSSNSPNIQNISGKEL